MIICPLYKAALLSSNKGAYHVNVHNTDVKIKDVALCDGTDCGFWNLTTGTCGLNNYSTTPLLNEY